jgi:hypothetical protein
MPAQALRAHLIDLKRCGFAEFRFGVLHSIPGQWPRPDILKDHRSHLVVASGAFTRILRVSMTSTTRWGHSAGHARRRHRHRKQPAACRWQIGRQDGASGYSCSQIGSIPGYNRADRECYYRQPSAPHYCMIRRNRFSRPVNQK